jgi:hypothetical protein
VASKYRYKCCPFIVIILASGFLVLSSYSEEVLSKLADGSVWAIHLKDVMEKWIPEFEQEFSYTDGKPSFGADEGK